jgi:SAM-dependent methyltransferase
MGRGAWQSQPEQESPGNKRRKGTKAVSRRNEVIGNKVYVVHRIVKKRGKYAFIDSLPPQARVLDVGCGNNSPARFKAQRPDCSYIGLDVGDYRQEKGSKECADEYILTDTAHFAAAIRRFAGQLDGVISSHNLEHCEAPEEVLEAMLKCLKPGGRLYLSFPCEESVRFPKRPRILNFFDDPTHKAVPSWKGTTAKVEREGLRIEFLAKRYRPPLLALAGFLLEPASAFFGRTVPCGATWSLYGFESVLWAARPRE